MSQFGFLYSLYEIATGNCVLKQSVSGDRMGTVLEHIAKTFNKYGGSSRVALHMLNARLDENTLIDSPAKMESLNTLVRMATEHYSAKAGKLVVETLEQPKRQMAENLRKVMGSPKKIKKLMAELELPSLDVGDTLLVGKFKNRKAEIKGFDTDEQGQPVAQTTKGDQKIFKPRIAKLMPVKEDEKDEALRAHNKAVISRQIEKNKTAKRPSERQVIGNNLHVDTTKALPDGFKGFDESNNKDVPKYPSKYPEHRGSTGPDKAESPFKTPPKGCTCHTLPSGGSTDVSKFCKTCQGELSRRGLMPKS